MIGTNAGILRVRRNETMAWVAAQNPPKGTQSPQEIFDQDFQQGNHNVLLAGGRRPRLWITDLRAPEAQWSYARHATTIAHLRSVNPHQVVVAGLQHRMALYDLRFIRKHGHGPEFTGGAAPLLEFPGYRNEAHVHTGWDVNAELGVVASGQDDGTVKLFSLQSGRTLRSGALRGVKTETPIKALMFQRMPRESMPSLFVGEGLSLRKYSFGTTELEDEG